MSIDQVERKEENKTFFANLGAMHVSKAKRQKLNTWSGRSILTFLYISKHISFPSTYQCGFLPPTKTGPQ